MHTGIWTLRRCFRVSFRGFLALVCTRSRAMIIDDVGLITLLHLSLSEAVIRSVIVALQDNALLSGFMICVALTRMWAVR